jgi:hypothetical protein
MKIWKMALCLLALCLLIGGCVALGVSTSAAEAEKGEGEGATDTGTGGAAPITPVYSEGLKFRSNGDGTCAVAGIGTCSSSCVLIPPQSPTGDTVTEILPFAFADCIITAIEIPATVSNLSALSFEKCHRLAVVRVAADSPYFLESDGALYTADGSVLVYCPAERAAGELTLHQSLQRVAAGAFSQCVTLRTVVFQGSASGWQRIIVGDDNDALYASGFRFTS